MQTFRGVNAESDYRYSSRSHAQLKAIIAPASFDKPVKMCEYAGSSLNAAVLELSATGPRCVAKICRPVLDGWITRRLTELIGLEDEVVIGRSIAMVCARVH